MKRLIRQVSGQALLITIFVMIVLLISLGSIIFLNQTGTRQAVLSASQQQARSLAEQGITFALNTYTDAAHFPVQGGSAVAGTSGESHFVAGQGSFTVTCIPPSIPPSPPLPIGSTYQETCTSIGYTGNTAQTQTQVTLQAIFSARTLGTISPNGISASAALELFTVPAVNGTLDVNWGPIALFDSINVWTVKDPLDTNQYPRKFALNGIRGTTVIRSPANTPPTTDNREYWAYGGKTFGFVPNINTGYYLTAAQGSCVTAPAPTNFSNYSTGVLAKLPSNPPLCDPTNTSGPGVGYFNTAGLGRIVLDEAGALGYSVSGSQVIYVDGDVDVKNVAMDLRPNGALIVNGNLTFNAKNATSGLDFATGVTVPPQADQEYPYFTNWPCHGLQGQNCSVTTLTKPWTTTFKPRIRGFIYVTGTPPATGNMIVNADTHLVGAVRVDGTLTIAPGVTLSIDYDDVVNHNIVTTSLFVQEDSLKVIAGHN